MPLTVQQDLDQFGDQFIHEMCTCRCARGLHHDRIIYTEHGSIVVPGRGSCSVCKDPICTQFTWTSNG